MPLVHDQAICIRKVEYSETSQILTLFSRAHGRIQAIAKGAHRRTKLGASKFDGGIDLLDLGDAVFSTAPERDLSTLCEWHQIDGHLALRRNLRAINLGFYAAELVTWLFEEHDAHPALFDRLLRLLDELATGAREEAFLSFELDLLREAGYMPRLSSCGICRREVRDSPSYFSAAHSSVICRNCEGTVPDRMEIDARLIGIVSNLIGATRLPKLTRHQTDPINAILANHIEHVLQKRLRMPQWILAKRSRGLQTRLRTEVPS